MPYQVRDLNILTNSSGSSVTTIGIGNLDDAHAITIYLSTANNILSSLVSVEVSQFDPAVAFPVTGVGTQSSAWYPLHFDVNIGSTIFPVLTSGLGAVTIYPVGFRGIRLRTSANSITTGTTIAFATKQILV